MTARSSQATMAVTACRVTVATLATALATYAPAAFSYVGPGAGLGVIASLVAVVLAVIATLVGIVLWPIRMIARRRKAAAHKRESPNLEDSASAGDGRKPAPLDR